MPRFAAQNIPYSVNSTSAQFITYGGDGTLKQKAWGLRFLLPKISAWTGTTLLVDQKDGASGSLYISASNILFELNANCYQYFLLPSKFDAGSWHTIVFLNFGTSSASVTSCRAFFDGVELSKGSAVTVDSPSTWGSGHVRLTDATYRLSEFEAWNSLPTVQEILDWHYYFRQPSSVSPTHWYRFYEGSGTSITDSSGNGNTGTASGAINWLLDTQGHQTQSLLTYSQDFTNALWGKSHIAITGNAIVAPDGTTTGQALIADAVSGIHYIAYGFSTAILGRLATYSVYVKAGAKSIFFMEDGNGSNTGYFDLANKVVGALQNATARMEEVGGGWFRCSITFVPTSAASSSIIIAPAQANGNITFTGDGSTVSIYAWGAQVEAYDQASPYRRVDQIPTEKSSRNQLAQRQNYIPNSSVLDASTFSQVRSSMVADAVTTPPAGFGFTNVYKFTEDGSASTTHEHRVNGTGMVQPPSGTITTFSGYFKKGATDWIGVGGNGGGVIGYFNLNTGVKGSLNGAKAISSEIVSVGNGWYRCSVTYLSDATYPTLYIATADGTISFSGSNGVIATYVQGLQFVVANCAGSFINGNALAFNENSIHSVVQRSQNLQTYSEQADIGFVAHAASVSANSTTAPNGTSTADTIIEDNTNAQHYLSSAAAAPAGSAQPFTLSAYMKAAGETTGIISISGSGTYYGSFNLSTGVASIFGTGTTGGMIPVGNGWYRCWITNTPVITGGAMALYVFPRTVSGFQGDGTSGIYIWGTQVVQANWPGDYTQTGATAINTGNIRSIWAQGQNFFLYSQSNFATQWNAAHITAADNTTDTLDPAGGNNASRFTDSNDGGATAHLVSSNQVSIIAGTLVTASAYVKAGTKTQFMLAPNGGGVTAIFNASTGAFVSGNGFISTNSVYIGNGWWRFSVTYAYASSAIDTRLYMVSGGAYNYTGDGTGTIYVYGLQLVKANCPGAYTPTTTAAINTGNIRSIFQ